MNLILFISLLFATDSHDDRWYKVASGNALHNVVIPLGVTFRLGTGSDWCPPVQGGTVILPPCRISADKINQIEVQKTSKIQRVKVSGSEVEIPALPPIISPLCKGQTMPDGGIMWTECKAPKVK